MSVTLRLKSGYLILFTAGHVWAVHASDDYHSSPWWKEEVRLSKEYLEPIRLTEEHAIQKVRRLLIGRLGLDEKALFLDTDPVFSLKPNTSATNGIRRYVFQWQRPESEEQRQERTRKKILPEASISAEVDAVSGDVKALNFFHRSLERPDPKIDIPIHRDTDTDKNAVSQ